MPAGGKRKGAGRKKGKLALDKIAARELVRQQVTAHLGPLIESAIANARGLKYLVVRQKSSGKFLRVTEAMARAKAGSDEEIIEVWEKDPSAHALKELLDRALDKPVEGEQQMVHSGGITITHEL